VTYLADTNIVTRRILSSDAHHILVRAAVDRLLLLGETVHVTARNLVEFHAVATRPLTANGLGLTRSKAVSRQFGSIPEVVAKVGPSLVQYEALRHCVSVDSPFTVEQAECFARLGQERSPGLLCRFFVMQ